MAPETGNVQYDTLLKDMLANEVASKASLEQRALSVVTTSGGLVTLLFALGALSVGSEKTFDPSDLTTGALALSLVLFLIAAILALQANKPVEYEEAKVDSIESRLREETPFTTEEAIVDIALTRVEELRSARTRNEDKADALQSAIQFEVGAIGAVAVAILAILLSV